MYLPYYRAKTYDYLAIRQCDPAIYDKVLPIIEPVTLVTGSLLSICRSGINFIFIVNPNVATSPTPTEVQAFITANLGPYNGNVTLAYIVNARTTIGNVNAFLRSNPTFQKAIIFQDENPGVIAAIVGSVDVDWVIFIEGQVSLGFIGSFATKRTALIQDCFQRENRNADYPANSTFSTLYSTYIADGYDGFGDFLVMNYRYMAGGGGAYAVAIHLSDARRRQVFMNHFVSNNVVGRINTAMKYGEARTKLLTYLGTRPTLVTSGTTAFTGNPAFPGLGTVKKQSMIHHMELIRSII